MMPAGGDAGARSAEQLLNEADLKQRTQELAETLRRLGHSVTLDDRVRTEVAALVLDYAPRTLANWRSSSTPDHPFGPPWQRVRRTVYYRLEDLLAWIGQPGPT